jgi:hypothetical protein
MWPDTVYGRADSVAEAVGAAETAGVHCDRDQANYKFELVGVVIHMGTAIGGHYYSYIRERDDSGPGSRWFEFNDMFVSPWEATDAAFERDCFGGVETYTTGGYSTTQYYRGVAQQVTAPSYQHERVRSANAFVLYYDRVKVSSNAEAVKSAAAADTIAVSTAAEGAVGGAAATSSDSMLSTVRLLPSDPKAAFTKHFSDICGGGSGQVRATVRAAVPLDLLTSIQEENQSNRRLRTIYDLEYFAFMQHAVRATANVTAPTTAPFGSDDATRDAAISKYTVGYPWQGLKTTADAMRLGGPAMCAFRLAVTFMLNTLSDSNQTATTPVWLGFIRQLISNNAVCAAWLLQLFISDPADLKRMLFQDTSIAAESMRTVSSSLSQICADKIWPLEETGAPAETTETAGLPASAASKVFSGRIGHLVEDLIAILLAQLPKLHLHWRRFGAYFNLLNGLANSSSTLKRQLLSQGLVGRLIDFALAGDSPHPELNDAPSIESLKLGLELKRDTAGRVVPTDNRVMGDAYTSPNFDDVFHLLRNLVSVRGFCHCAQKCFITNIFFAGYLVYSAFWSRYKPGCSATHHCAY